VIEGSDSCPRDGGGSAHDAPAGLELGGARAGTLAQDRRARISRALVEVLAERGYAGTTVELVLRRAGVSSRTFYALFDGLDECLVGIMSMALERTVALAGQALEGAESWQEGVREALAAVLAFFDGDPALARVCIVETLAGGPVVLEHRARIIEIFRRPVAERIEREVPGASPLVAEGVMSSVLGIMHAHIVMGRSGSFLELLGPLMSLATAPYLGSRSVEREIERGDRLARTMLAGEAATTDAATRRPAVAAAADPAGGIEWGAAGGQGALPSVASSGPSSARARARECLLFLAEQGARGASPSNREIAAAMGIAHQSQISRLLADLVGEGLVAKRSEGSGKRNAWRLTPRGEEIARSISAEYF
jgi:AcrR family transcriptional regulator